ncbi:Cdc6/Cdc18 family protein [Halobiforma nitratireducens]|uniref:AAA ATPase n=1 Tax=Halobiforma nitratireducens JCM 10879 TaxID=1227454 RepID=M0LH08_9EURY|nr:AAA family ATPase [Halobiforma nitratireducens]EMA31709.1 AAA ATPase [Halobiforma nitratireducens JCM 10879]
MIADPRVFDDSNDDVELLHRGGEMRELLEHWRNPDQDNILLSGPSGVGKSLFAKVVLDRLEEQTAIHRVRVNCLRETSAGILRAILEDHPNGPDNVATTTSTDAVRRQLRSATDRETVVVLDEGDELPETDVLGDLLRQPQLTVIAIAHDATDWLSRLDVDNGHSFDRGHIALERYHVDELTEILHRRARQGFHRADVVSRDQLEYIADEVAGVARKGIQWLWGAALEATDQTHYRIRDGDIQDGKERAWHHIRELNIDSLPTHHQVLYAIVHEAGEISGSELHARYDEIAEEAYQGTPATPIGERARRKKFPKLVEYDLVDYDGPTRDRTYWPVDDDVEPQVNLPTTHMQLR